MHPHTMNQHGEMGSGSGNTRPLSKIVVESFNKIAKLTGDVDNEPSTPRSGEDSSDKEL